MERKATAIWKGSIREGSGSISTDSGILKSAPYSFVTRFENSPGTNPEELIAAAHSACFSMALSAQFATFRLTPEQIQTTAAVTLEKLEPGWTVTKIHLDVKARIPGASDEIFQSAATTAKANCPISRLLKADITMTAKLENG
jgi:osmotically inducible protein OsmC